MPPRTLILRTISAALCLVNGCWSGIPWCCVRQFCARVLRGRHPDPKPEPGRSIPYVRCPRCRAAGRTTRLRDNGSLPDLLAGNLTGSLFLGWRDYRRG